MNNYYTISTHHNRNKKQLKKKEKEHKQNAISTGVAGPPQTKAPRHA